METLVSKSGSQCMSQAVSEFVNEELQMKWWCYAATSLTNINQTDQSTVPFQKVSQKVSELVKELQL